MIERRAAVSLIDLREVEIKPRSLPLRGPKRSQEREREEKAWARCGRDDSFWFVLRVRFGVRLGCEEARA